MEEIKKDETIGRVLKETCKRKNIGFEELYQRIFDLEYKFKHKNTITKKDLKNWIKDKDFPNLDAIYFLAEILEIPPNYLLELKNNIQSKMRKNVNKPIRKMADRMLEYSLPIFNGILFLIGIALTIFVAMLLGKVWDSNMHGELDEFLFVWDKKVKPLINTTDQENNINNDTNVDNKTVEIENNISIENIDSEIFSIAINYIKKY